MRALCVAKASVLLCVVALHNEAFAGCPYPKPAPQPDQCIKDWKCILSTSEWVEVYASSGASCDDQNDCTTNDKCSTGGACSGTSPPGITCPNRPSPPMSITKTQTGTAATFTVSWSSSFGVVDEYRLWESSVDAYTWVGYFSVASPSTSMVLTRPDGTYYYKVQACNIAGCSDFSLVLTVTVLVPPGTPGTLVAPASSSTGSFSLSWGAAAGTVSRYEVFENGVLSQSTLSTSATISGKANGTYAYKVRACNSSGCGGFTAESSVLVLYPPSAPGAITGPGSSATGSYILAWGASSGTVNRYDLYENGVRVSSGSPLSATLTGRQNGTYVYKVQGCNSVSCGVFTADYTVTVLLLPGVPGTMTGPTGYSNGTYSITWGASSGSVGSYMLFENDVLAYNGPNLTVSFTGKPDGTYQYKVRACNNSGCSTFTTAISATVLRPPGAPGALSGQATSSTGAYTLTWTAASGTVDRYDLYENDIKAGTTTALSMGLAGRTNGTYRYKVQACNGAGCGPFTADFLVSVSIPLAAAPGPITGPTSSTTGTYTLNWTVASGEVSRYDLYENGALAFSGLALTKAFTGKPDGAYRYAVQACNSTGCGPFTTDFVVTVLRVPPAPAPVAISTTNSTSGTYTISWTKPSGYTVDGYRLEQRYGAGSWIAIDLGPVVSYTDTQGVDGTYSYRVYARNAAGMSPATAEVGVTVAINLTDFAPDAPFVDPSVPAQQWVGTIPGTPSVDGGAAAYRIEIEVPPGRGGMQPSLALTYGSRNGNGVAGVGWSLSGTSSIYRCPNTLAQDGANRPVRHDANDRLCYAGQRLVPVAGAIGSMNSEYRTDVDAFARITLRGAGMDSYGSFFRVEHKSGRVSHYAPLSSGGAVPDTWYLVREYDPHGNCVDYGYQAFSSRNDPPSVDQSGLVQEWVLSAIQYTGTGVEQNGTCVLESVPRKVEFQYTRDREDKRITYSEGVPTEMTARLAAIVAYAPSSLRFPIELVKSRIVCKTYSR
jgi:Salmonella virulence plasmid 65kDa B protein